MRAPSLVYPSLIAAAIALAPVPAAAQTAAAIADAQRVPATLRFDRDLRALELVGPARRPYVLLAGTRRARLVLAEGVVIGVSPDAVLALGYLDMFGHAYVPVPVNGTAGAGDEIYTQALVWSQDPGISILPDQATEVVAIQLEGPQTHAPIPPFAKNERIRVLNDSGYGSPTARIVIADGLPPSHVVELQAIVKTSGHVLRIDDVRHRGTFTRVFATLERPHPEDEEVIEGAVDLGASVSLGAWAGKVEIVLDVTTRAAPSR